MQLIDRIEINYFRSVYSISIKRLSNLNVFIGPNDAGKSNVLRALNLFFNNQSGYEEHLQFLQDVTHLRQEEARDAKGRLTIWIRVHFNNVEKWKTLPSKFYIKKSWNRYSQEPEVTSNVNNRQSLTRFQNKIRFHYIPAVKERDIFASYLNLLYETLSDREDIEFSGPADALSEAVNNSIVALTEKIRTALDVKSKVQIPNDLESIFERLEFYTDQDSFKVPLSRRGDGLQVRHIPHILQYISENNRGLNIWAYEEPENSLEMTNAFALAREFENEFATNNQIFITSHSPAFYSLTNESTRHFLVKKEEMKSSGREQAITVVDDLTDAKVADIEMGVAQLVADRSKVAYDEIEHLKRINAELGALNIPVVLTEGKTDARLLKAAWVKLNANEAMPFDVKSCDLGGAGGNQENAGADELKKILESTTKDQMPVRIGLFDRDAKGNFCFENLKKHNFVGNDQRLKVNQNGKSGSLRLEPVNWGSPYDDYLGGAVCIEMLFPFESFDESDYEFEFKIGGKKVAKGITLLEKLFEEPSLFDGIPLEVRPKFENKTSLAKKLEKLDASEFENFRPIFQGIEDIIQQLG